MTGPVEVVKPRPRTDTPFFVLSLLPPRVCLCFAAVCENCLVLFGWRAISSWPCVCVCVNNKIVHALNFCPSSQSLFKLFMVASKSGSLPFCGVFGSFCLSRVSEYT